MTQDHENPALDPVAPESPLPPAPEKPTPTFGEAFRRLGPAGYLAVAWAALPALGGILLLANLGTIAEWLRGHQQMGLAIYIGVFIVSAGFGMLPTYSQSILAGWAFGVAVGFPAALAGFVGAAMIGYLLARLASEDRAEQMIAEHVKARAVRDALIGHGFWKTLGIVTLLRIPPNSPFALTNLAMASTGVSKRAFIVGTAVGMAPRTFIAVWLASQVQDLTDKSATRPTWLIVGGIVAAVVVFGILYVIGNRAVKKVTASAPHASEPSA